MIYNVVVTLWILLTFINLRTEADQLAGPNFSNVGWRYPPDKSLSSG